MIVAALLMTLTGQLAPPPQALTAEFYGAIWYDLQLNAMIGNGNWPASLWLQGSEDKDAVLHIQDLRCREDGHDYLCAFVLFREGGPVMTAFNQVAPDRLGCRAKLFLSQDEGEAVWAVHHDEPPEGRGHTRTSLQCDDA